MIYYLENIEASGYNRYIVLKMTHKIKWLGRDDKWHESWAYLYGQEDNMLKDEIRSRSRMDTLYAENLKSSFFVAPLNEYIQKDCYFIVGEKKTLIPPCPARAMPAPLCCPPRWEPTPSASCKPPRS